MSATITTTRTMSDSSSRPSSPVKASGGFSILPKSMMYSNDSNKDDDNVSQLSAASAESFSSTSALSRFQRKFLGQCKKYSHVSLKLLYLGMFLLYTAYFISAVLYNAQLAKSLIIITTCVSAIIVYVFIRDHFGDIIYKKVMEPVLRPIENNWHIIKWFFYPSVIISLLLYIILVILTETKQLQSLSGITVFISFSYLTSKYPDKIVWRPVIWGYLLQFLFAIFVLRTEFGYNTVDFLGNEITKFINYAYEGAVKVYGDPWLVFHAFTFMGMSILIYMGSVMNICYYYGLTQALAGKMAWLMQRTMGTTAIESLAVSANIFLDGMATLLMLKGYLIKLTDSELHTFSVGGHSTVAGFVFGLFVLFGAPPEHLLSAAVMSAPAVFAITKLNFPETRPSKTKRVEDVKLEKGGEENAFEASANGAAIAAKTAAAVVTNYISFLGMLAFLNATLMWLGGRVGHPEFNFDTICMWCFTPIALLIGIDLDDCTEVGRLIGLKVFTTEIYAYQELGKSYRAGLISERSRVLATYAMCGFSSLSTLAISVGVWRALCPPRVKDIARHMPRALVNSNLSCFMTAAIAGMLYTDTLAESKPASLPPWASNLIDLLPGYRDLMGLVPGLLPD